MDATNPKEGGLPSASTRAAAEVAGSQPLTATQLLDVTAQSSKTPRGSALLYPADPELIRGPDPHHHYGLTVLHDGRVLWIKGWRRLVKGREVIELRFSEGGRR